jgi:hypothetical protein
MVSTKKVSGSQEKKMGRKEALDKFKRITEATAILAWREERGRYVQNLTTEQAQQFQESLEDTHPPSEELKANLGEDVKSYEAFWDERLSGQQLFESGYDWLPECKGLVIGEDGEKPIVLLNTTAEILILLTENVVQYLPLELLKHRNEISYSFHAGQCDIAELIPAMHTDIVSKFLSFMDGDQISDLILTLSERAGFMRPWAISKIASILGEDRSPMLWELGDYCMRRGGQPLYGIHEALTEHGGEAGDCVARKLIKYIQVVNSRLQEALDSLGGAQDE